MAWIEGKFSRCIDDDPAVSVCNQRAEVAAVSSPHPAWGERLLGVGSPQNLLVKIGTRGVRFNPSAPPDSASQRTPAGAFGLRVGLRRPGAGSPMSGREGTGGREGSRGARSADVSWE